METIPSVTNAGLIDWGDLLQDGLIPKNVESFLVAAVASKEAQLLSTTELSTTPPLNTPAWPDMLTERPGSSEQPPRSPMTRWLPGTVLADDGADAYRELRGLETSLYRSICSGGPEMAGHRAEPRGFDVSGSSGSEQGSPSSANGLSADHLAYGRTHGSEEDARASGEGGRQVEDLRAHVLELESQLARAAAQLSGLEAASETHAARRTEAGAANARQLVAQREAEMAEEERRLVAQRMAAAEQAAAAAEQAAAAADDRAAAADERAAAADERAAAADARAEAAATAAARAEEAVGAMRGTCSLLVTARDGAVAEAVGARTRAAIEVVCLRAAMAEEEELLHACRDDAAASARDGASSEDALLKALMAGEAEGQGARLAAERSVNHLRGHVQVCSCPAAGAACRCR